MVIYPHAPCLFVEVAMLCGFKAMLYDQESIALTPLKRCFIGEKDILVRQ